MQLIIWSRLNSGEVKGVRDSSISTIFTVLPTKESNLNNSIMTEKLNFRE